MSFQLVPCLLLSKQVVTEWMALYNYINQKAILINIRKQTIVLKHHKSITVIFLPSVVKFLYLIIKRVIIMMFIPKEIKADLKLSVAVVQVTRKPIKKDVSDNPAHKSKKPVLLTK
jgi:hypothetical protein